MSDEHGQTGMADGLSERDALPANQRKVGGFFPYQLQPVAEPKQTNPAEVQEFLRMMEVALTDANGEGIDNDWVATLEARDWLRYIAFDYMVENMPIAAPRLSTYQVKVAEWEEQWQLIDQADPKGDVARVEHEGKVPMEMVTKYMMLIQYRAILAETDMKKVNDEMAPLFEDNKSDLLTTLKIVASAIAEIAPRVKWVAENLEDQSGRLNRLHDLIEQRGVSTQGE